MLNNKQTKSVVEQKKMSWFTTNDKDEYWI